MEKKGLKSMIILVTKNL